MLKLVTATMFAAILVVAPVAQAGADDAETFIREFGDRALAELTADDVSDAEKERRFRRLLEEGFDMRAISQFIVARYWRAADEADRQAFVEVFKDYLVQRFLPLFDQYQGEEFTTEGLRVDSNDDSLAWVAVRFERDGRSYRTEWRVRYSDGTYNILDVRAEGSSMALTLREEYASVMRQHGGLPGLVERLREQVARGAFTPDL